MTYHEWKNNTIRNALNKKPDGFSFNVHILLFHDDELNIYIAHALEYDIIAENKSQNGALNDLKDLFEAQVTFAVERGNIEGIVDPAPDEYWEKFYMKMNNKKEKLPKKILSALNKGIDMRFTNYGLDNISVVNA